jgi:hypothetical protein
MAHMTHIHPHVFHPSLDRVLVLVTVLLGMLGGFGEVLIFSWVNTSNFAWGGTALYGNGAYVVPFVALPVFTIVASLLAWRWQRRYESWWAVPMALLLFVAGIAVGGMLAVLT